MSYEHLLSGVRQFHEQSAAEYSRELKEVADRQEPARALFIGCIDARVLPNEMTGTLPGELFTYRNVGNIVPPQDPAGSQSNDPVSAAVQFAIYAKKIQNIIVCGHSDCGAVHATHNDKFPAEAPALQQWTRHIQPAVEDFKAGKAPDTSLDPASQIAQIHVIRQLENLKTIPGVQERLDDGTIQIHGWFVDLQKAELQAYNPGNGTFSRIG